MRIILALALAAVLAVSPATAGQEGGAAELLREAYRFVREYALHLPDTATMLGRMLAAAQLHAVNTPVAAPALSGDDSADLEAVAAYAAAAVRSLPPRQGETLLSAVLRAMIQDLADPLAAVFLPPQFASYLEELRGEYGGIGAQVNAAGSRIVISDVTADGPASRAGIVPGDALLEVNGRSTFDRTPDTVLDYLHGRPGTPVALIIQRGASTLRITLTREAVRENPTRWAMLDARVGYLRLLEFTEQSARDVGRALEQLRRQGAAAIVLDLRQNTGGLVEESVAVASFFLADGVVAVEESRDGMVSLPVQSAERFAGPTVVLVDFFTASAGEIVAGALQDAGALLVGTKTFGKATVQSVTIPPLPGGWGLRVTTARYLTRSGRMIEGRGLQPDRPLPMNIGFIQSPRDLQLREAQVLARARLAARAGRR